MHCVQYVVLSRADLQRGQNVRPHLMHALAKPVCGARSHSSSARSSDDQRADGDRIRRAAQRIERRVVAEQRARRGPLRPSRSLTSQASSIGGLVHDDLLRRRVARDALDERAVGVARACSSICACWSNLYVSPAATEWL